MTEESSMFLTGPGVVREALGEVVDAETLGGAKRARARTGSATSSPATTVDAAHARARAARLPAQPQRRGRAARPAPPAQRRATPRRSCRRSSAAYYDVRDVIGAIVDGGELLEVSAGWARNLVTGFARLDGRTVGVDRQPAPLHRRRAGRGQL